MFSCSKCEYTTRSRKKIREHLKKVHKIKGGKERFMHGVTKNERRPPIKECYTKNG